MSATTKQPTDAQIIARLKRSKSPKTAGDLGTTALRLRSMEDQGVVAVSRRMTGKRGRPAIEFTVN